MRKVICGINCLYQRTSHLERAWRLNTTILTGRSFHQQALPHRFRKVVLDPLLESEELPNINTNRDAEFLDRSLQYGITSIKQLNKESSFVLSSKAHSYLVDTIPWRSSLNLWQLLLDYGVEAHGVAGAKSIWRGLKYRHPRTDLSSDDKLTTTIWLKLLNVAAQSRDLRFIRLLCERHGIAWQRPMFFSEVVNILLRNELEDEAILMCHRLQEKRQENPRTTLDLFFAYNPSGHKEFRRFLSIYDHLQSEKLYDEAIRYLWTEGRADDAFMLHKSLILRGDFPSSFLSLRPFLAHLAKTAQDPGPFLRQLAATGAVFVGQARLVYELEQRNLQNAGLERGQDLPYYNARSQPNGLSDSFTAKAFAARGLSFDFVLNSLRVFGLNEIGPQSLREIGIAAIDLETFANRLAKLDHLGIDTGGTAFARIVRKLCNANEHVLLRQILRTDMHHDVFEDRALQQRLLRENLLKSKWTEVNILLTMLNQGDVRELKADVKAMLLSPFVTDEPSDRTLLSMAQHAFNAEKDDHTDMPTRTVEHMIRTLRRSKAQHRSRAQRLDRARFIAGFMQDCAAKGVSFPYFHWRHVLAHLGANGGLEEVYALMLWIPSIPSTDSGNHIAIKSQDTLTQIMNTLFDFRFQTSLIHWSLRRSSQSSLLEAHDVWRKSLQVLKHLETKYGLNVNLSSLRRATIMRCRSLHHVKDTKNAMQGLRSTESARTKSLEMLRWMHELWSISPAMRREELGAASKSLRTRRVRRHWASTNLTQRKKLEKSRVTENDARSIRE